MNSDFYERGGLDGIVPKKGLPGNLLFWEPDMGDSDGGSFIVNGFDVSLYNRGADGLERFSQVVDWKSSRIMT